MGLFKRKEPCSICGGEVSRLTDTKLSDGVICGQCRVKCTQYLMHTRSMSVTDIRRNMADNLENQDLYDLLVPEQIGSELYVDAQNKLWCVSNQDKLKNHWAYIFRFSDITDYEFIEDQKIIPRSRMRRAQEDGFLFGKLSIFERKAKETIDNLSITIKDSVKIHIINFKAEKDKWNYRSYLRDFENIVKSLDTMMQNA